MSGQAGWLAICCFHKGNTAGTRECDRWFPETKLLEAKLWLLDYNLLPTRACHKRWKVSVPAEDHSAIGEACNAAADLIAAPDPTTFLADENVVVPDPKASVAEKGGAGLGEVAPAPDALAAGTQVDEESDSSSNSASSSTSSSSS